MDRDVKMILDTLNLLYTACSDIQKVDACRNCPIKHNCLDMYAVQDIAEEITAREFTAFLKYADGAVDETDYDADYADHMRKWEREEADIDAEYGI